MEALNKKTILSARDVEIQFSLRGDKLTAIRGCSLDLYEGETLAIVGESGSGKSVFTKSFLGMLDQNGSITGGSIMYEGNDLAKYTTEKEWRTIRGKKISMVMQDPMTSLNPLKKVGMQIQESIELHQGLDKAAAKAEAIRMLDIVGIPNPEVRYNQYPHEFSGGMRQRAVIAIAVACHPDILICDEPTTALDVTIQAQILNLIKKLNRQFGMTTMLITHDLGVVATVCDKVAVMYGGLIMEYGTVDEIFYHPRHPYTMGLLGSIPHVDGGEKRRLIPIDGTPPDLINPPKGCPFSTRCKYCMNVCTQEQPPYFAEDKHRTMCWLLDGEAPKNSDYEMRKAGVNFGR